MEQMLMFTREATYDWEDSYFALIYATIARSARTFSGICQLLRSGLAVQAAMLTRALFEDVIVAHWLVLNHSDHDWLVERFLRQRDAVALHQRRLQKETGFLVGPLMSLSEDAHEREAELIEEFGRQAARDWWDPGRKGKGEGKDVGLRKLVTLLEQAARERKMFHPRFAGGAEPLLDRTDRVVHKWLSQCMHHTVVGLPFAPTGAETAEVSSYPMLMVGFSASWLFAQQVYLLFELNHMDFKDIDTMWYACMGQFLTVVLGPEAAEGLAQQWFDLYGDRHE
jgi:hypothetical protein